MFWDQTWSMDSPPESIKPLIFRPSGVGPPLSSASGFSLGPQSQNQNCMFRVSARFSWQILVSEILKTTKTKTHAQILFVPYVPNFGNLPQSSGACGFWWPISALCLHLCFCVAGVVPGYRCSPQSVCPPYSSHHRRRAPGASREASLQPIRSQQPAPPAPGQPTPPSTTHSKVSRNLVWCKWVRSVTRNVFCNTLVTLPAWFQPNAQNLNPEGSGKRSNNRTRACVSVCVWCQQVGQETFLKRAAERCHVRHFCGHTAPLFVWRWIWWDKL